MSLIYLSELKDYRIPKDMDFAWRYVENCLEHINKGSSKEYMYVLWLCEKYVHNLDGFPERAVFTKFN